MKRYLFFLLLPVLTGCWRYETDDVRMTGWVSSPFEDQLVRALVDSFTTRHPDISVSYNPIQANYPEKLQLMLGTRTAPDVFMLESYWAPSLINYDVLMPLDDFIARDPDFDLNDFEPALLDAFRSDGKLYGIPKDYSTLVLFYNPQMFAEAGLNDPPLTWEDLVRYARLLTRDTNGDGIIDQYGFGMAERLEYVLPFIWQNGGDLLDEEGRLTLDDDALVEALKFLQGLKREGIAALPTDVGASWNMDGFGRRKFAMATSGLWAVNLMEETFAGVPYAVAPLPVGRRRSSIAFVVGYVMPKDALYPEEGWSLLRFLTSKTGQLIWARSGVGLPPRKSIVAATGATEDPVKALFIESATYARPWQLGPNQRIVDEVQTALQAILMIDTPVEEALERMSRRLQ